MSSRTFYYPTSKSKEFLKGKTLILPIVSVANIAQLTIDLLVASLELEQIGVFDSRDLIPVIGGREDGKSGLTTPLELYGKDGVDVVMIHQRSPVLKARKNSFICSILNFAKENKVAAILILSGVDLSNRIDSQMRTSTYKLLPTEGPPLSSTPLAKVAQLPTYTYERPKNPGFDKPKDTNVIDIPATPGGGLTRRFIASLPTTWNIPTACVLEFVMEGDNREDARQVAGVLINLLNLRCSEIKQPPSWSVGLFGGPPDQSLYG